MDKFLTLIRRTCAVFGVQASDDLLDAYWSVLGGLPIDALSAAFGRTIAECETMPRPAVILRLAGGQIDHRKVERLYPRVTAEHVEALVAIRNEFKESGDDVSATLEELGFR